MLVRSVLFFQHEGARIGRAVAAVIANCVVDDSCVYGFSNSEAGDSIWLLSDRKSVEVYSKCITQAHTRALTHAPTNTCTHTLTHTHTHTHTHTYTPIATTSESNRSICWFTCTHTHINHAHTHAHTHTHTYKRLDV